LNRDQNQAQLNKNSSALSFLSKNSVNDNIKILNNIDDKIQNLKKKIIDSTNSKPKIEKIDYEKFKNIHKQAFINMLYFLNSSDMLSLFWTNKNLKSKVLEVMIDYSLFFISSFEKQYVRYLKNCNENILAVSIHKRNSKKCLKINLIIRSKIIADSLIDKSVTIGYNYKFPEDKIMLKNYFKFDVEGPRPLSFWIMREYTNVIIILFSFIKMN
jgi:hypothetical protein